MNINIMGFLSLLLYLGLGWANSTTESLSIYLFLAVIFSLFVLLALSAKTLYQRSDEPKYLIVSIIAWAVLFRVVGVFSSPIFEDDFYRYLWDAYQFVEFGTPYGKAPSEFFGDNTVAAVFSPILDGINHPDIATIYAPIQQYIFALAYVIAPAKVWPLQLLYSCFDFVVILLLARVCRSYGLLLFAWCPLLIKETAFTAHPDVVGVLFLLASWLALSKGYMKAAIVLISISLCTKIFTILFLPLLLLRCPPRFWILCPLTIALVYSPFIYTSGTDFIGLVALATHWQFNSSLYGLLTLGLSEGRSKIICALFLVAFYAVYACVFLWGKEKRPIPRGDWIMAVFFLCAPVVNAWYLVWMLVFSAIFPSRWAWVASASVSLSYVTGLTLLDSDLGLYQQPLWVHIVEYGVILCALIWDIRAPLQSRLQ